MELGINFLIWHSIAQWNTETIYIFLWSIWSWLLLEARYRTKWTIGAIWCGRERGIPCEWAILLIQNSSRQWLQVWMGYWCDRIRKFLFFGKGIFCRLSLSHEDFDRKPGPCLASCFTSANTAPFEKLRKRNLSLDGMQRWVHEQTKNPRMLCS